MVTLRKSCSVSRKRHIALGLFSNSTFEIGFERIKRPFSQNKDIDGTRSKKIHEFKTFQVWSRNYPNNDRATVKAKGDLQAMNGKNKDFGALRIPCLCTG